MLVGPFKQIVTLRQIPLGGPVKDSSVEIIEEGGIIVENGVIKTVGKYRDLFGEAHSFLPVDFPAVVFPGIIDAHTHLCWAGSRAKEYALRLEGATYQQIAAEGGGILHSMQATRSASEDVLLADLLSRLQEQLKQGITTCEIKSGYGLDIANELKMLSVIKDASLQQPIRLISTCLAAHTLPPEFTDKALYLQTLQKELWPLLFSKQLCKRIDIFVEKEAFPAQLAKDYLMNARKQGFSFTVHAGQFSPEGIALAAETGAASADHLECIDEGSAKLLARSGTAATVLPGATLGLGLPFPHARMLLDTGNCVAIASDWNPGSAPMGRLLTQAALLGAAQKLSMAETWAGITFRAAHALSLKDRGRIEAGQRADLAIFPCSEWLDVLYFQGSLLPKYVMIGGSLV